MSNHPTSTTRTLVLLLALAVAGLAAAPLAAASSTEATHEGPTFYIPGICVPFTTICTTGIAGCVPFTNICYA